LEEKFASAAFECSCANESKWTKINKKNK
jgi:hypothetical protein